MKKLISVAVFIILSCLSVTCTAGDRSDKNLVITYEKNEDGKKYIKAVFKLDADPEKVYRTLRDVEMFPEFMPGSAAVEIIEKKEKHQVVKFSGSRGLLSADITMKRFIDDENKKIGWTILDGPPKEVNGYWLVKENSKKGEPKSVVYYTNYVDAGVLVPGFLVRKYMREDVERMVPNIIKRVKSDGTWLSEDFLKKKKNKSSL